MNRNDTDSWDECPNQTSTSCYWDKRNYFGANLYIMMVRVKNTVLNITTSTKVLTFRTKDIGKFHCDNTHMQNTVSFDGSKNDFLFLL